LLGSLGASALTVGLVTGAGEAVALVLRLVSGPWADRSQRHWQLTVVGYAMTAVCVPLLAITTLLGVAGVAVAATLILLERVGKAVRSPAKSALLARMAASTGRGRGFAVQRRWTRWGLRRSAAPRGCGRRDRGAVAGTGAARGAGCGFAAAGPAAPAGPVGGGTGAGGRCARACAARVVGPRAGGGKGWPCVVARRLE